MDDVGNFDIESNSRVHRMPIGIQSAGASCPGVRFHFPTSYPLKDLMKTIVLNLDTA